MRLPGVDSNGGVPIIGQPYQIEDWIVSVIVTCSCPAHKPVYFSSKAPGQCAACKKSFQLGGLNVNNGQIGLAIQVGTPPATSEMS